MMADDLPTPSNLWGIYVLPRDVAAGLDGYIVTKSDKGMWSSRPIGTDGHPAGEVVGNPRGRFHKLPDLLRWLGWKRLGEPAPDHWEFEQLPDWVKL